MAYKVQKHVCTKELFEDMKEEFFDHAKKLSHKELGNYDGYLWGYDGNVYTLIFVQGMPDGFFVHVKDREAILEERIKFFIKLNNHARYISHTEGWMDDDFIKLYRTARLQFEWVK